MAVKKPRQLGIWLRQFLRILRRFRLAAITVIFPFSLNGVFFDGFVANPLPMTLFSILFFSFGAILILNSRVGGGSIGQSITSFAWPSSYGLARKAGMTYAALAVSISLLAFFLGAMKFESREFIISEIDMGTEKASRAIIISTSIGLIVACAAPECREMGQRSFEFINFDIIERIAPE